MTCGMGMMSGQLIVGAGGATSAGVGQSPILWLLVTLDAAAGALYLARGKRPTKGAVAPAHATATAGSAKGGSAGHGKRKKSSSNHRR